LLKIRSGLVAGVLGGRDQVARLANPSSALPYCSQADMPDAIDALILDLLEFIAPAPRPYSEVHAAWRTSCPRLPIWEDALDHGFIERRSQPGGPALVALTPRGRQFLDQERAANVLPPKAFARS
jgi:hypothetical protein